MKPLIVLYDVACAFVFLACAFAIPAMLVYGPRAGLTIIAPSLIVTLLLLTYEPAIERARVRIAHRRTRVYRKGSR